MLRQFGRVFLVRFRPFRGLSQTKRNKQSKTVLPAKVIGDRWQRRTSGNQAAARKATARLGADLAWSRKFRSRRKWTIRSVLLRLPDRPALFEHPNKGACPLCRVAGNQQKLQMRKRTSEQWLHPISLGSSWFSPLGSELW